MHGLVKMYLCADLFVGQHFIRFGTKLQRLVVGIPMGTNCAPLVADFFLLCYERGFMISISDGNIYFDNMVRKIYPANFNFIKQIPLILKHFCDLHLFISNEIVSFKIYGKRDDIDIEIVNFSFRC